MSGWHISLVDLLAFEMGCAVVSDLRFLDSENRRRLARKVEKLASGDAALKDWNDALDYLGNAPQEQTPDAAKRRLVALLLQEK